MLKLDKSVRRRLARMHGKVINGLPGVCILDGTQENCFLDETEGLMVSYTDDRCETHHIPLKRLETRGNKYYYIEEGTVMSTEVPKEETVVVEEPATEVESIPEVKESVEEENMIPEQCAVSADTAVITTDSVIPTDSVLTVTESVDNTAHGLVFRAIPTFAKVSCQFCRHTYYTNSEGDALVSNESQLTKINGVDVCPDCLELAQSRLLGVGIPQTEITSERVLQYLAKCYGLVNHDVIITVNNENSSCNQYLMERDNSTVSSDEDLFSEDMTPDEVFKIIQNQSLETMVNALNALGVPVSLVEIPDDFLDAEDLTHSTLGILYDDNSKLYQLTALWCGHILDENLKLIPGNECVSLDSFFHSSYLGTSSQKEKESEINKPVSSKEEDASEALLQVDTFWRLQNCSKEENNNKLVKIVSVILPEDDNGVVIYRVADRKGNKYRVIKSKLRPSKKSF